MEKKNELMIKCKCHGYHWLYLWWDIDDDLGDDFSIAFVDYGHSFWERLEQAIRHIFNKNNRIYFSDILLEDADLKKVKELVDEYLARNNEKRRQE